jgi:hypothetical protein
LRREVSGTQSALDASSVNPAAINNGIAKASHVVAALDASKASRGSTIALLPRSFPRCQALVPPSANEEEIVSRSEDEPGKGKQSQNVPALGHR